MRSRVYIEYIQMVYNVGYGERNERSTADSGETRTDNSDPAIGLNTIPFLNTIPPLPFLWWEIRFEESDDDALDKDIDYT